MRRIRGVGKIFARNKKLPVIYNDHDQRPQRFTGKSVKQHAYIITIVPSRRRWCGDKRVEKKFNNVGAAKPWHIFVSFLTFSGPLFAAQIRWLLVARRLIEAAVLVFTANSHIHIHEKTHLYTPMNTHGM
jgi:hypothetical protein